MMSSKYRFIDLCRSRTFRSRAAIAILLISIGLASWRCGEDTGPTAPSDPESGRVLAVPFVAQQTQVWCWAAAIEMVSRYYGRGASQCQILSGYLGANCCAFQQSCVLGAPSMNTIQAGLFAVAGLSSQYVPSPLSLPALRNEIDAGRPVIIGYRGSFGGHVVVVHGYDTRGGLYILDPFYGPFSHVPYGTAFSYSGTHFWSESIVNIR